MRAMNREIKFRGLSKKNNQWLYGYFFNPNGRTVIYKSDSSYWEVHSSSVGQYTGLKDCNGKEIYEGDILRSKGTNYYIQVVFHNGAFRGMNQHCNPENVVAIYEMLKYTSFEVIGNIHDNPKLRQ